ncbi:MAG: Eco57I restriction-modification methylase domain-containing protein [Candidatus Helarchaeota archaeon]
MSSKILTDDERIVLNLLLDDLRYLFKKDIITQDEIKDILNNLKSDEVKSYITNLSFGSKPETALREAFVAGKSILIKFLFGDASPEVRTDGFVDYLIKDDMGRGIALELKPLFEADTEIDKAGHPVIKKLKQKKITPEKYNDQIFKYVKSGESEFIILTNLKDWFFYSKDLSPKEVKYFSEINFFDFIQEYDVVGNLKDYLERKEKQYIVWELIDKRFLESLKTWVNKLSQIKLIIDEKKGVELIIGLINKFIFVQTLDDYGVIEFNWIRKRWNHHEQMWQRKGKLMVLEKFFDELDEWFYLYYDTELFKEKILNYIEKNDDNINKLYENLQIILGISYLQVPLGATKGIMQYNFRYIDEDIFGKAYETFLGEIRKEKGVYYTSKFITQYIVEKTVGKIFDELLVQISKKVEDRNLKDAIELVSKFVSIRILDPACGSGSFLIKTFRIIVEYYIKLDQLIKELEVQYAKLISNLKIPKDIQTKLNQIYEIKRIIGFKTNREMLSKILIRHIHGNDLDNRAIEVAKVNMWLEAIRHSPKDFRYDKLPSDTNFILPNLEMNLCNGDSLIGLPEEETVVHLYNNNQLDIIELLTLRKKYLENPMKPECIEEILEIKNKIRKELDKEFLRFLENNNIPIQIVDITTPFHWAFEFWFNYFNEDGEIRPEGQRGFDIIVGNPPWVHDISDNERIFYTNPNFYQLFKIEPNTFQLFTERSFSLVKERGFFGFIIPSMVRLKENYIPLREVLIKNTKLLEIIDVGYAFDVEMPATIILFLKAFPNYETITILVFTDYKSFIEGDYTSLSFLQEKFQEIYDYRFVILSYNMYYKLYKEKSSVSFAELLDHNLSKRGVEIGSKGNVMKCPTCDKWSYFSTKKNKCSHCKNSISPDDVESAILIVEEPHSTLKTMPLIMGDDIDRYLIKDIHYLKLSFKGIKYKLKVYNHDRILIRETGNNITATLGPKNYSTLRTIYNLKLNEGLSNKIDLKYILGILNSSLINFIYLNFIVTERETFPKIRLAEVRKLPIRKATLEEQKPIIKLVDRILLIKKLRYKLIKFWEEWSTKMKNDDLTLKKILSNDASSIREGEFNKSWTSKVSFYPSDNSEEMDKSFNNFKILAEDFKSAIKIYGFDENNKAELIYEMEFNDRDLMVHVYNSLIQNLESKKTIENLTHLFDKTIIPIIKEVNKNPNELTPNIVKKSGEEFEKWLKKEKIEIINSDIIKFDNEIEDLEVRIDAHIFKLYDLSEEELKIIFNSLLPPLLYREKVFSFFRTL